MESKDFLKVLENIYGALTYDDWPHAREYVKMQIDNLKKQNENEVKRKSHFNLKQKQKE